MKFRKYQHIERYGTQATAGIENGVVYVFPKLDGTNASCWIDDGVIKAGSRNGELTIENDNAGFYNNIVNDINLKNFFTKYPYVRLYGEFLVKHTIKTYEDSAWRKFYVFDVCTGDGEEDVEYLSYETYKPMLEEFGIEYIPPLAIINNTAGNPLSPDILVGLLEKNTYLIKEGAGKGEGCVLKNYHYKNKFGKAVWAKIVSNEFKTLHGKTMGVPVLQTQESIEQKIVEQFVTESFVEKEFAKIINESEEDHNKLIPKLLGRIWYELINEESWNILKAFKNPTINFKVLNRLTIQKIKEVKKDLFQRRDYCGKILFNMHFRK